MIASLTSLTSGMPCMVVRSRTRKPDYREPWLIVERLDVPRASEFDALAWARYRQSCPKGASPSTVNHEQRYPSSEFSELIRLGVWSGKKSASERPAD
jgi:hypothetical protein